MMFKNSKFVLAALTALLGSAALCAATTTTNGAATGSPTAPKPAGTTATTHGATAAATEAPVDMKKISEAFGHFIGRHLKSPNVSFDLDYVIKGMREGVEGKPAPMTDKEYEQAMVAVQKQSHDKMSTENLKAAEEYLHNNSNTTGFIVIEPNKLLYKTVTPGNGATVEAHGTPQINYTGKFIDGTVFGSSENSGGPVAIPLDQTIPGFSKAIVGMKEGEKRIILVHPDLGYGTTGHLPPNSLLIFDIEVIKAKAPKADIDDDNDDEDYEDEDGLGPLAMSDSHGDDNDDDNDDDEDSEN